MIDCNPPVHRFRHRGHEFVSPCPPCPPPFPPCPPFPPFPPPCPPPKCETACGSEIISCWNTTTNEYPTELFSDGKYTRVILPDFSAWTFFIQVVGRRSDVNDGRAGYSFQGCIYRNAGAGSCKIQGSVSKVVLGESNPNWDCNIDADPIYGSLRCTVKGENGKTIDWVAIIDLCETPNNCNDTPCGPQGPQGTTGAQGPAGPQGINCCCEPSQGPQGATGAQGMSGASAGQGTQGAAGSTGPQGTTGSGTQGTQGATGSTGTQGATGSTGVQGTMGASGVQGTTGSVGSQGTTGTTGSTGLQGTTGSHGAQGTTGPTGSQGVQGIQGAQCQCNSKLVSSDYHCTTDDHYVGVDCTNPVNITLPSNAPDSCEIQVKCEKGSSKCTVKTDDGSTIDDTSSYGLTVPREYVTATCRGGKWHVTCSHPNHSSGSDS